MEFTCDVGVRCEVRFLVIGQGSPLVSVVTNHLGDSVIPSCALAVPLASSLRKLHSLVRVT